MLHMYGVTKNPYTKRYFREAMDYFREDHDNVVFFYVSDDMDWGRNNIKNKRGDLFFVGEKKKLTGCLYDALSFTVSQWKKSREGTESGLATVEHVEHVFASFSPHTDQDAWI